MTEEFKVSIIEQEHLALRKITEENPVEEY
jgi:hypothetical protein